MQTAIENPPQAQTLEASMDARDELPPVAEPELRSRARELETIAEWTPVILPVEGPVAIRVESVNFWYGRKQALFDVNLSIAERRVTAFIGPSGCGKSTLLRLINRLNDLTDGARLSGRITVAHENIHDPSVDVNELRRKVGMVFQKSNPFPKSIFENVAYGLRIGGENRKEVLAERVESCLKRVGLWNEVSDRVNDSALDLSGGQQQRLCIARAIAVEPEVILMDEPCSALDPIATGRVEDLIEELKRDYTIVIVTHNLQQASRVSDHTAFLWMGKVAEYAPTTELFTTPRLKLTEDYITGRFG